MEKLAHVRVGIRLAKIATMREQWENSLSLWRAILDRTQGYKWGQGFTCGMVNLSQSYVMAKIGATDTSQSAVRLAREILDREGWDQYWLAMMATHWRNYLQPYM